MSLLPASPASSAELPGSQDEIVLVGGGDVAYPIGWFDSLYDKVRPGIWQGVAPLLARADLRFCNLETPLTRRPPAMRKRFLIRTDPARLDDLLAAGWNLLALANNHAADAGAEGIADTILALEGARSQRPQLAWAGSGRSEAEAWAPAVVVPEGKALRVAFLALGNSPSRLVATPWGPRALKAIAAARQRAEVVVVSVHAGSEYRHLPGPDIVSRYRAFVDAGADLVLGHHPHVPQGLERRGRAVIAYSLGNLSFASLTTRHHATGARLFGALIEVRLGRDGVREARIHPLWVNNREPLEVSGRRLAPRPISPQLLEGGFRTAGLAAFREWCAAIPDNPSTLDPEGRLVATSQESRE
jgi:poly-gamma-glutamate synthesis protein (capsule biosynthesis protein)